MKVKIQRINPVIVPYSIVDTKIMVSISSNKLTRVTDSDIRNMVGTKHRPIRRLINCNANEQLLIPDKVVPFPTLETESMLSIFDAMDLVSKSEAHTLLNVMDTLLDSQSAVMQGETHVYGTLSVFLHSLGSANYRIEWYSKMTGASTSIAKLGRTSWSVIRKWAPVKNMADISQTFESRKQALTHFMSNVDILKTRPKDVENAKRGAIDIFLRLEGIADQVITKIPKVRLQGAIGLIVEIRSKHDREKVAAKGILMQITGREAEVKVTERIDYSNPKAIVKIPMERVWLT